MLTPQEQAEYDSLVAEEASFSTPSGPQATRGFLPRLGQGIANIPGDVMAMPTEAIRGVAGLFGRQSTPEEEERLHRLRTRTAGFQEMDAPQGIAETAGDIAPIIGREIGLLAVPASKATKLAEGLGAGTKLARTLGQTAAGALSGIRQSGSEAATQAGEFAAGQALADLIPGGTIPKTLMRMAAQAIVPIAGQAVRGNDPLSKEALIQSAVQAGIQGAFDIPSLKRPLIRKGEPETPPVQQSGYEPSPGLAAELGLADAPMIRSESASPLNTEEDLFSQTFGAQSSPQTSPTVQYQAQPAGQRAVVKSFTRDAYEREMGRSPVGEVPSDINTPPEMQGDVFSGIGITRPLIGPKPPPKVEVVSTGIRNPDGTISTGPGRDTPHKELIRAHLLSGGDPTTEVILDNMGFVIRDPDGSTRFATREEAYNLAEKTGQLRETAKNRRLASEIFNPDPQANPQTRATPETLSTPESAPAAQPRPLLARGSEAPEASIAGASPEGQHGAAVPARMRLAGREAAFASSPAVISLARGAAGGLVGYATGDTEEERIRNAALLGTGAAFGPAVARRLAPVARNAMEQAARNEMRVESGKGRTLLGRATRALETGFNLGRKPETLLAQEKGKGAASQLTHQVQSVIEANRPAFEQGMADPAARAVGEKFIASGGTPADIRALDAALVPQGFKDALKAMKSTQRETQIKLREGESDPQKRALYASTLGSYQTRLYRIDTDPKMWTMDEPKFQQVVDEFQNGPLKGMDREVIAQNLRQGLAERRGGSDPFLNAGGNKIKQTLFQHRLDLTPDQWSFIDQMASDPRTPAGAGKVLTDFYHSKSIDPAGQQFLRALAGNKKLTDLERQMFRDMADKHILTQNYRDLLGEIKDPFERQVYTLNKLFGSVAQAQTISEIADTTLEGGLKMAMDAGEFSAKLGDPTFRQTVEGYVQLPEAAGFGKLAGKYVPRDVRDALMEVQSEMPKWFRMVAKANNWVKEAATAWNPSVHVRQAAQTPLFLIAARVGPWDIGKAIEGLSRAVKTGDDALMKEMRQQHITGANYSASELRSVADRINTGKGPGLLSRTRKAITGAYGIPDDFVRITAYLKHKPRYLQEALDKGMVGDVAERYARDKATIFVNDHTMNYGQVAKAVKVARNIPGFSPFASYSAELLRLTKNLAKDVAQGSPGEKVWGAVGLSTLYALPLALSAWAKSKFLTPEQQAEWDSTEGLMSATDRSNLKVPFGVNDKGAFNFLNINPWIPAGDAVSTVRNALKGDWESLAYSQPFVGLAKNPLASAAVDVAVTGEHGFTHEKLDTAGKKLGRISEAVLPSWAPPSGFMFKRAKKSLTPNDDGSLGQVDPRTGNEYTPKTLALSVMGAGVRTADPKSLKLFNAQQKRALVQEEANQLRRVLRSGAPRRQKEEAQKRFLMRRKEITGE